ncbi:15270_t:CDS:2, partial [Dentiscutata heterogama]
MLSVIAIRVLSVSFHSPSCISFTHKSSGYSLVKSNTNSQHLSLIETRSKIFILHATLQREIMNRLKVFLVKILCFSLSYHREGGLVHSLQIYTTDSFIDAFELMQKNSVSP